MHLVRFTTETVVWIEFKQFPFKTNEKQFCPFYNPIQVHELMMISALVEAWMYSANVMSINKFACNSHSIY